MGYTEEETKKITDEIDSLKLETLLTPVGGPGLGGPKVPAVNGGQAKGPQQSGQPAGG